MTNGYRFKFKQILKDKDSGAETTLNFTSDIYSGVDDGYSEVEGCWRPGNEYHNNAMSAVNWKNVFNKLTEMDLYRVNNGIESKMYSLGKMYIPGI